MSKKLEIEIRYRLLSIRIEELRDRLTKAGFKKDHVIHQEDVYYTSKHKDFIKTEECLRIRTVNGSSEITWKPPSSTEMKQADEFWKEEVDLAIDGQLAVAKRLLKHLDFIEYSVVKKEREVYSKYNNIEVAVDNLENLGYFVEIEIKSPDIENGKILLKGIAESLGLDKEAICKTPYRDLVPR